MAADGRVVNYGRYYRLALSRSLSAESDFTAQISEVLHYEGQKPIDKGSDLPHLIAKWVGNGMDDEMVFGPNDSGEEVQRRPIRVHDTDNDACLKMGTLNFLNTKLPWYFEIFKFSFAGHHTLQPQIEVSPLNLYAPSMWPIFRHARAYSSHPFITPFNPRNVGNETKLMGQ